MEQQPGELLSQGAEAKIYSCKLFGLDAIVKVVFLRSFSFLFLPDAFAL
jgi:hypothetical protein